MFYPQGMNSYTVLDTPKGSVLLRTNPKGLCEVLLSKQRGSQARQLAKQRFPDATYAADLLPELQDQMRSYFAGRPVDFDVQVDLGSLTPFQQRVLRACARLRYGQTATYAELAASIGHARACRAVGNALARNPIPIVIPCHRVLGSGGSLCGFSAEQGTNLKRWLLDLEARALVSA